MTSPFKSRLVAPLRWAFRLTSSTRRASVRLLSHARLASDLRDPLPASVVVLGKVFVSGEGRISFGADCLLYPEVHLEAQAPATLKIGSGVVLSRGVHLVAMESITLGPGCMIGEFTSLRDANHTRTAGVRLRDAGHTARPITLGREVWIGRGVTVLGGVTIGDFATVGANAVVTRDVPAGAVVAGVPAIPLR